MPIKYIPSQDEQVKALIAQYGADLTPSDRTSLASFSQCESGFRQFDTDGGPFMSGYGTPDCGAFQINSAHWDGATATSSSVCVSLEANVKIAVSLYRMSGSHPWDNSKSCWNKPVPGW